MKSSEVGKGKHSKNSQDYPQNTPDLNFFTPNQHCKKAGDYEAKLDYGKVDTDVAVFERLQKQQIRRRKENPTDGSMN